VFIRVYNTGTRVHPLHFWKDPITDFEKRSFAAVALDGACGLASAMPPEDAKPQATSRAIAANDDLLHFLKRTHHRVR